MTRGREFNLRPAVAVSPGEILGDELEARGWTQKDLAEIMGRPHQAINEIVKGTKQITPETAIELAQAFGTSSEFWLNLESNYRLHEAEKEKQAGKIVRKSKIYSTVPVRELIRRGWIKATGKIEDLEDEVCRFLQIRSLDEVPKFARANFRVAAQRGPEVAAQISWMARVSHLAKQQTVGPYSLGKVRGSIDEILDLTDRIENVSRVPELLASVGIHFVIVRHLSKTYLDGATWFIRGRPVIALTLRYDRIDSFWFSLLHELAHIVQDHGEVFLDNLYDGSSSGTSNQEKQANQLAQKWLIEPKQLKKFAQSMPEISKEAIADFASKHNRYPGIIVGQMHYAGFIGYNRGRGYLEKVSPYLKGSIDPTFYGF